jgi:hypothetical protein
VPVGVVSGTGTPVSNFLASRSPVAVSYDDDYVYPWWAA